MTKKARKPPAPQIQTAPKKVARKPKSPKPPPGADPLVRMLPCPLTDAERRDRAWAAAELGATIDQETARLAEYVSEIQHSLKEYREKAHILRQQTVNGTELREVQCREELDTDRQNIVLIRCDTDKVVETLRKATAEDANLSLFEDK